MLQGLLLFSAITGLQAIFSKSAVYCSGMEETDVKRITEASGFQLGCLPFRYLGVPINATRLKVADCEQLLDKMTAIIRIWSSRHISFTGRLQLVNSILMTLHVYWGQLFLLPKDIYQDM